jgi:Fe-S cluster assembly protein SufD
MTAPVQELTLMSTNPSDILAETLPSVPVQASPPSEYEQGARDRLQKLLATEADWLQDLRLMALSRFEALGFPTRRQEAWKYINIRPLLGLSLNAEAPEPKVCPPALHRHLLEFPETDVIRLVFVNGRFNQERSTQAALPAGVIVSNLKSALQNHPELVRGHLGRLVQEETDAFAALNSALFDDGVFIYLPDNTEVQPLIQLVFAGFGDESRATYPRNLIVLGRNAKASLAVEHIGLSPAVSFNNSVNEFILAEGAQADCTLMLSEGPQGWHLAATRNMLAAHSRLSLTTVTLAGHVNRHTVQTLLQGEDAELVLNGLDVLEGKTEAYHHTVTEHWVPNCTARQYYKSMLDDQTKSEFNSLVFVAKGAIGTDSEQLNKNLLLSDDARVWTRPQLQINADDVKCAHGAATGQLDEAQLFYLASRGLNCELAQALLMYGFAEDIIQKIPDTRMRKYLDLRVLANLHRTDALLKQELGGKKPAHERLDKD